MQQVKILEDKENKVLGFREILAVAPFSKTPTNAEVVKMFSEKYKVSEEGCVIKKIKGNFGSNDFTLIARIYPDKAAMDHIETKKKKPKKAAGAK
jgi:ribosomal protein S24E